MKYETFLDAWNELSTADKIACFNAYASEYDMDDYLYEFSDDFFNEFYADKPAEAVRACFFGNIRSYSDEYIRFNGYGNLESLSEYDAEIHADDHTEEIYEHEDIWSEYIDESDYEEDEE